MQCDQDKVWPFFGNISPWNVSDLLDHVLLFIYNNTGVSLITFITTGVFLITVLVPWTTAAKTWWPNRFQKWGMTLGVDLMRNIILEGGGDNIENLWNKKKAQNRLCWPPLHKGLTQWSVVYTPWASARCWSVCTPWTYLDQIQPYLFLFLIATYTGLGGCGSYTGLGGCGSYTGLGGCVVDVVGSTFQCCSLFFRKQSSLSSLHTPPSIRIIIPHSKWLGELV